MSETRGPALMTDSRTRTAGDLAAIGSVHAEDETSVDVRLVVGGSVRRSGRGSIELHLAGYGLDITRAELIWLVTTNKGWVHMRGEATVADGDRLPFRADLFAAGQVRDGGPDRIAVRIYAAGDDPNRSSPIRKLGGWMAAGSIVI
jgi:hypothetical protein